MIEIGRTPMIYCGELSPDNYYTESILFSKNNIEYNINKFTSGEKKYTIHNRIK